MESQKIFILKSDYYYDYSKKENPSQEDYFFHMHNDYEFLYFIDGDVEYSVDTVKFKLQKGDFLIIKPRTYHGLTLKSNSCYERIVFYARPTFLSNTQKTIISQSAYLYHLKHDDFIRYTFENLKRCHAFYNSVAFDYLSQTSLLNIINALPYLPKDKSNSVNTDIIVNNILDYIKENIAQNINAKVLSKRFFMSSSWINHSFNNVMNISLKQYINQQRIMHAQSMIMKGVPIEKVMSHLGFENYSTFFRHYKTFLGTIPAADKLAAKNRNNPKHKKS